MFLYLFLIVNVIKLYQEHEEYLMKSIPIYNQRTRENLYDYNLLFLNWIDKAKFSKKGIFSRKRNSLEILRLVVTDFFG